MIAGKNSVEDLGNKLRKYFKIYLPKVVRKDKKIKGKVEEFQKTWVIEIPKRDTRQNIEKTY